MSFRNAYGIYHVIEKLLKASSEPLTCVDLYDTAEVRKYADSVNRVSDYLGHMWRRKLLKRFDVPRTQTSAARYAYSWRDMSLGAPAQRHQQPRLEIVPPRPALPAADKPKLEVIPEANGLRIELPGFTVVIKSK